MGMIKTIALAAALAATLAASGAAQAAWCVWPGRPAAPHPCRFGGVPGYWWGNAWVFGPWHRWGAGPAYRVYPRWRDHDWDHR